MASWRALPGKIARLLRDLRESAARGGDERRPGADERTGRWIEAAYRSTWGESGLVGTERDYRLYLPPSGAAGTRVPLIVMLHGCRQDALAFESGARMERIAREAGIALLYPEQRRRANPERCWNWFANAAADGQGEAALIAGMVEGVTQQHGIDTLRIYVAGLSAGGAMASILAGTHPALFAAAAVHSGLMYRAAVSIPGAMSAMRNGSQADPLQVADAARARWPAGVTTMPMMVIHGDRDNVVNPRNAEQTVAQFARLNGLALEGWAPISGQTVEGGGSSAAGHAWKRTDWHSDGGIVLRRLIVTGLGHAWSGGDPALPFNDPGGPDAGREIWEFFRAHARRP